jgi:hypothetical protein
MKFHYWYFCLELFRFIKVAPIDFNGERNVMKLITSTLAAAVLLTGLSVAVPSAADARHWHGKRVCTTKWVHHRRVRRCWRR